MVLTRSGSKHKQSEGENDSKCPTMERRVASSKQVRGKAGKAARARGWEVIGNLDRRITRSGSKQSGGENDLKCQRSTCVAASKQVGSKGGKAARARGWEVVGNLDRRITQSGSKQSGGENDLKCRRSTRVVASKQVGGKAGKATRARGWEVIGNLDRRITRSGSKQSGGENDLKSRWSTHMAASKQVGGKAGKAARTVGVRDKGAHDCVELDIDKFENKSSDALPLVRKQGEEEKKKLDFTVDAAKLTGVKRKRMQEGVHGKDKGWTKEQELALHKAYFTAKPSPDFWNKVAKMVPGKSAQECFDKVHSDNRTPLRTKPSSRARKQNSPISDFELFDTAKTKSKMTRKTKCKSHVGRKTVRQLLQKYCHVNQDSESDLFTLFEPSVNPSVEPLNLTPTHLMRSPDSSSKSRLSRFCDQNESPLTSPLVLKKVKNMGLHEKYIDQLHTREHKRKVAFSRCLKSSAQSQKGGSENSVQLKDVIKAAKEALVSDAKEVINKYQYSQANIMEALSDSEEFLNSDNDEDDAAL